MTSQASWSKKRKRSSSWGKRLLVVASILLCFRPSKAGAKGAKGRKRSTSSCKPRKPKITISSSSSSSNTDEYYSSEEQDKYAEEENKYDVEDDLLLTSWSDDDFLQFDDGEYDDLLFYSEEESESYYEKSEEGEDATDNDDTAPDDTGNRGPEGVRKQASHRGQQKSSMVASRPSPPRSSPLPAREKLMHDSETVSKQPAAEKVTNKRNVSAIIAEPSEVKTTSATEPGKGEQQNDDATMSISGMTPWVRHYLSTRPGLLVIPLDFWQDNFNLAQLPPVLELWVQVSPQARGVQYPSGWLYKQALQRILAPDQNATAVSEASAGVVDDIVEWASCLLYQLVHQRYALSPRGLEAVRHRFLVWQYQSIKQNPWHPPPFGRCPRALCRGFALVPSGRDSPLDEKDTKNDARNWRYCGSCRETWLSMSHEVEATEGCAWGSTLGPLFHLTFPEFLQGTQVSRPNPTAEPRVFGFRLHPGAVGRISTSLD